MRIFPSIMMFTLLGASCDSQSIAYDVCVREKDSENSCSMESNGDVIDLQVCGKMTEKRNVGYDLFSSRFTFEDETGIEYWLEFGTGRGEEWTNTDKFDVEIGREYCVYYAARYGIGNSFESLGILEGDKLVFLVDSNANIYFNELYEKLEMTVEQGNNTHLLPRKKQCGVYVERWLDINWKGKEISLKPKEKKNETLDGREYNIMSHYNRFFVEEFCTDMRKNQYVWSVIRNKTKG